MHLRSILAISLLPLGIGLVAFRAPANPSAGGWKLVDPKAGKRVKALYANLQMMSGKGILFGHQDDLAYGVHWKQEPGRSDVKEVCGAYPAVFGWDVSKLGKYPFNIDTVDFARMKGWIREAYRMGGINTISWHLDNPVTGGGSWDTTGAVRAILPGGQHHDWYKAKLDLFADFLGDLRSSSFFGHPIPVIFRPFHEQSGAWFWWGRTHCTPDEYKALWRFTVEYLRDTKNVHNLLYAFSPDVVDTPEDYLRFYPGDDYVDIMGIDDYHDLSSLERAPQLTRRLGMVAKLAEEHGKVSALTETGYERIPNPQWWTDVLLHNIKADASASRIAYLMVWRNARTSHHYAPFPGHPSAENFVLFTRDPIILLENELPNMYRPPKQ